MKKDSPFLTECGLENHGIVVGCLRGMGFVTSPERPDCLWGGGFFPGIRRPGRESVHIHLVPRLKMCDAMPPLPLRV